ncbi:MAG: DNA-methyltransferase [Microbacteriaceae bacterium]
MPEPFEVADGIRVVPGRAEDVLLPQLADNSVDAVVTDPPYEIDLARQHDLDWDRSGVAFDKGLWAEVLRVTKPGGNLLAFGAPRTVHRLTVAIEDAGWEVRDSIVAWVKAYGFPKALETQRLLERRGHPQLAAEFAGVQNVLKPAHEPIVVARKPLDGATLADNIVAHGVGGLGIDNCRISTDEDRSRRPGMATADDIVHMSRGRERNKSHPAGRWPTNMVLVHGEDCIEGECERGCPAAELDQQRRGAARYFPQFFYSGRASRAERPVVDGVQHHSVKPIALMEWLVELAAPLRGMLVLDPFAGTGTTGQACARTGRRALLGEQHEPYLPLIRERFA